MSITDGKSMHRIALQSLVVQQTEMRYAVSICNGIPIPISDGNLIRCIGFRRVPHVHLYYLRKFATAYLVSHCITLIHVCY